MEENKEVKNISQGINNIEGVTKEQKKKKVKGVTLKRVIITAACVTVVFAGSNIYASTQGYQNIFFMIKDMVSSKDTNNRDEILSDKDITISYKPIEIAKGIRIQVNRLVVKDNKSGLYLQVERTEEEQDTTLTFKVNDGDGNKLGELSSYNTNPIYTANIWLPNYKNDINELELKINKDSQELATLKIDLVNRVISVVGNQEAVKKISEEELKKYLGAFALLDYADDRYEGLSGEILENNKKIDVAKQIAKINNINIYTGEKKTTLGFESDEVIDAEKLNNIVQSFTQIELEEDGLMKLGNTCGYYKSVINGKKQYMPDTTTGYKLSTGLCLDVKDISYTSGIYNVTFTYCYPTQTDYDEGKVEELPVYEMSVGLILNENNEYSKYFISSRSNSTLVDKTGNNNNNIEFNEILGEWKFIAGEQDGKRKELFDLYGSSINYGAGGLTFNEDGTFEIKLPGIHSSESKFETKGYFEIQNNVIKLKYTGQYAQNSTVTTITFDKENGIIRCSHDRGVTLLAERKTIQNGQMNENEATQILRDKFLELVNLYTEPDKYFTKGNEKYNDAYNVSNYEQVLNNTFLNDGKKEFENNLPAILFKKDGKIYMRNGVGGAYTYDEWDSFKNIVISNNKITSTVVTWNSVTPGSQDHEYRESKFSVIKNGDKWLIDEFDVETIDFDYGSGLELSNQEEINKALKKEAIKKYLELVGVREGSPRAVLEKIGLISNTYGDSEKTITSDNFIKTDVKYSDYKATMMRYMTEDCFNKNFTGGYRNINGVLYYFNGGGSGIEYEVGDIISENGNNVTVQVYNVHIDGSKELKNMTFGIDCITHTDHIEYVISSVL